MRRVMLISVLSSVILLSGCSLSSFTSSINNKLEQIVRKDQVHEQGFVVTKATLYKHFDQQTKRIDLSDMGLITIPDICNLLDSVDYEQVRWLDVSKNSIRLLNTDLSCLVFLRGLDLSHNKIQAVQTLGELPALQELDMKYNALTTTENFPDFPVLEKLYLAYNNISEVKDLDHLKNLIVLELQNNVVEHIIGVEKLEQLKQLRMDYETIKGGDLTPILEKLGETELIDSIGNVLGDQVKDKLLRELPF